DLLVVLHLGDGLRRHDDLPDRALLAERDHAVLEVVLDLVLVPGIGVDDVPAKHCSDGLPRSLQLSEDGVHHARPERVENAEVGAGDDDEPQHDAGGLADLPAIRPLYAAELDDARAQEVAEAAAAAARGL